MEAVRGLFGSTVWMLSNCHGRLLVLWYLIVGTFNSTFGSSHSASFDYQKWPTKVQIKPQADYRAVDSPKNQTNGFIFSRIRSHTQFIYFLENLRRAPVHLSPYSFIWPLGTPFCCKEVVEKYRFTFLRTDILSSRTKSLAWLYVLIYNTNLILFLH